MGKKWRFQGKERGYAFAVAAHFGVPLEVVRLGRRFEGVRPDSIRPGDQLELPMPVEFEENDRSLGVTGSSS